MIVIVRRAARTARVRAGPTDPGVVDSRDMCVGMVGCEWERGGECWDGMATVHVHTHIHSNMDCA